MLSLITEVGELVIHAKINESLGDNDRAQDLFLDAYSLVFDAGVEACLAGDSEKCNVFLKHYPSFVRPWNEGYQTVLDRIEAMGCGYCQDPDYHTCPNHG